MNKEECKKRIKQEFEKRNLNGFANHTILADLMANICTDVVKENCNLHVVTAPLRWQDVLDDFYVEHDKQISNGEFTGKMILVFRDWLDKNYKVPERNGR